MMKKITFLLGLTFSLAFALSNSELVSFYEPIIKAQFPKAKLSILKREKLENGFESVELLINNGNKKSSEILFVKDNFIFPDIIDIKNKKSYREEYEFKKFETARANFEKNVKSTLKKEGQIIALGDSKKPKIYVFSDPECPYCKAHLETVEVMLAQYQVNFVLTAILSENSIHKVAQIYTEIKSAKTDSQKISILRKYYGKDVKTPKANKKAYDEAVALSEKYTKLGLRSVPTIIEFDK